MATNLRQRQWFGAHQPQTLQIAVALLYWNALLSLIFGLLAGGFGRTALILVVADVASGFGVANEKKWGYVVALAAAVIPVVLLVQISGGAVFGQLLLTLMLQVALIALLLHPQSRSYQRIWFK